MKFKKNSELDIVNSGVSCVDGSPYDFTDRFYDNIDEISSIRKIISDFNYKRYIFYEGFPRIFLKNAYSMLVIDLIKSKNGNSAGMFIPINMLHKRFDGNIAEMSKYIKEYDVLYAKVTASK